MTRTLIACALALALAPVSACDKSPAGGTGGTSEAIDSSSPAGIGAGIATLAAGSLDDLAKLVKGHPDAKDLKPKVEELKESFIQKLVALGHKREALSAADRVTCDKEISKTYERVNKASFKAMDDAAKHYREAKDYELASQIAQFNTIGQYGQFSLLRKQEKKEAARLGIK